MKVTDDELIHEAMKAQKKALKSHMIEHYVGGAVKLVPYERYGMKHFSAMSVNVPLTTGRKIARLRVLHEVFQEREKWNKVCVVQFCFKGDAIIKNIADEITKEFYEEHGKESL